MSDFGIGQFHVHWTGNDGQERRKAYRTHDEADQARNFLEGLGISPEISMHVKNKVWGD